MHSHHPYVTSYHCGEPVLILVVMDDALAQKKIGSKKQKTYKVLILVVMDDALAPNSKKLQQAGIKVVLILVVMDDALAQD